MSSSLRLIPSASHPTSTSTTTSSASVPGLPDPLQPTTTTSIHPLETRLLAWRSTQDSLKLSLLRRTYGIAEPVRRGMELAIVQAGDWRPAALGSPARVHDDILSGRDASVDWEDVYTREDRVGRGEEVGGAGVVHAEMERRVGMGKW